MEKILEYAMLASMLILAVLLIVGIVGFIITWQWHCLLFAAMSAAVIWAWYDEEYKSKGKTIWKKNLKH